MNLHEIKCRFEPIRQRLARLRGGHIRRRRLPSEAYLRDLMLTYQTKNLSVETAASFKARIDEFLALSDYQMEGLEDPAASHHRS